MSASGREDADEDEPRRLVHFTPLRYPGGKGKLAAYVKQVIRDNGLDDGEYIEPYAGGAAIALELLFQEYVSQIRINDVSHLDPWPAALLAHAPSFLGWLAVGLALDGERDVDAADGLDRESHDGAPLPGLCAVQPLPLGLAAALHRKCRSRFTATMPMAVMRST